MPRIALLSNINMDVVIRLLGKEVDIYRTEGYGNELGTLMNPASSYHTYGAGMVFFVMDLMELLEHDLDPTAAEGRIRQWFRNLQGTLKQEVVYYVSDSYLWGMELETTADMGRKLHLEGLWQQYLEKLCQVRQNVRILPFHRLIETLGSEKSFSMKMWYMGKILLSGEAQKRLCTLILDKVRVETRIPRKVLLLDLDNTLWGGLAGESDHTPIELSESHIGLAYKNLQRVILQMQRQGVLLGIVSKNNREDAMEILDAHPHMVLRSADFAVIRINWRPKYENIQDIAGELNLGLDSFVFWDDNPAERELVGTMLPEVAVPDFPASPEELAPAMGSIYREYFEKAYVTDEDRTKTAQYTANAARKQLEQETGDFQTYLEQLQIVITRVDPAKHMERLAQLVNKTNQFNLTTIRYTQGELARIVEGQEKLVYLYRVTDKFGDNGVVAAAVVDVEGRLPGDIMLKVENREAGQPVVEEFVMSCRVMGKNIEYAILEDVESDLKARGYTHLAGVYLPTAKNQPVEKLYDQMGYRKQEPLPDGGTGGTVYYLELAEVPKRPYAAKVISAVEADKEGLT